jgi:hypothetical protein
MSLTNKGKVKITEVGQPCRHCDTPVVRRQHKPGFTPSPSKAYYFEWWLACPECGARYMIEAAKKMISRAKKATDPLTLRLTAERDAALAKLTPRERSILGVG